MRGYIDRKALDVLFDRREIRTLSIGKGSLDAKTVKYVSIVMNNIQSLGMLHFYVKCHETGASKTVRMANTFYKDTAREDEAAVKWEARIILCNAIQFVNSHRLTQGYYPVSFITPTTTAYTDMVKSARDAEFINISHLPDYGDGYVEDDFLPNPDGSRPWCDADKI